MNTVDALNELGKALLGYSYTENIGLTDAETIKSIADQVKAAGGLNPGGGGSGTDFPFPIIVIEDYEVTSHTWEELCDIMTDEYGDAKFSCPIVVNTHSDDTDSYEGFYYPFRVRKDSEEIIYLYACLGAAVLSPDADYFTDKHFIQGAYYAFEPPVEEGGNPVANFNNDSVPLELTVT